MLVRSAEAATPSTVGIRREAWRRDLAARVRRAELLIPKEDLNRVWVLRKVLNPLSPVEAMELPLSKMGKTPTNAEFLAAMSSGR